MKSLTLAALMMCGSVLAEGTATPSVLARLAGALEAEPEEVRADFATISLNEMIASYERELDNLSVPGKVSLEEIAKQARWGRAVARFLDDLYAARNELDAGAPVELFISEADAVHLMVGRRLIVLTSPRVDLPQQLERQIVKLYCDSFACDPTLLAPPGPLPIEVATSGTWSFMASQGPIFETRDGLAFMFTDLRDRNRKERVSLQVSDELDRVAQALAKVRERGRRVDMQSLRVEASEDGREQKVVFSITGEFVRLQLPALVDAPALVELARPWLAARSAGHDFQQRFPRAESLMSRLLAATQGN